MAKGKDEKKGKRHKSQAKHKDEERHSVELHPFDNKFNIDGVISIVLSTMTQKAVGCVVGEDITTEDPWIYIKKEKVEDNLDLHEESSEFLPFKQCIIEYPEEEMLIGFDKPIEDDKQEFFFCTKLSAQQEVALILEKHKAEMQERLRQSVQKRPGIWTSFGSEIEVSDNIIQNLRSLIEVEVDSKYPLYNEKKKFRLRLVEDAIDGYVEILPGRFPITNVYRKRVDCAIQVAPVTTENEAQTNPTFPKNIWTQYKYEYEEPKLDAEKSKHLIEFMMEKAEDLDDTIHVNEYINLYTNDYLKIAKQIFSANIIVNRDVLSFRDVISCKNKMVSDVALDPFVSGILAASYTNWPFNKMYTRPFGEDEVNETTFGTHLVLVWCNTDHLKPKLFLHSFREVNRLRYCAQRPNILLGGCTNGQIVIWDLKGKLENVETKELLTPSEQKHRIIMHSFMNWMKHTDNINIVYPTVITNLDYSHNAPVVSMSFIIQNHQMTRNGKIEKLPDGEESLQFFSCGMDGKILVWDLLTQPPEAAAAKEKKSKKLGKRPSSLFTDVSEFRDLNNILMPIYKINIKNKTTQAPYPLTCMVIENNNFKYKARNPETEDSIYQRTFFDCAEPRNPDYVFTNSLELSDKLGNFFHCKFGGHDFDQGQVLNYENINKVCEFMTVHDGPIRTCSPCSIDPHVILTVGGRVWAIWDVNHPGQPLFYRKSHVRYVAGIWASQQAGVVVIARADSYFETWTLLQHTKGPGRLIRMTGNTICDQFSDDRRQHVKKNTFSVTDSVGAVRIYMIPKANRAVSDSSSVKLAFIIRQRIIERQERYKAWLEAWKVRYGEKKVEAPAAEEQQKQQPAEQQKQQPAEQQKPAEGEEANAENKKEEIKEEKPDDTKAEEIQKESGHHKKKKEPESSENKWKEKQEKIMYEILLEKKKLNLDEIEQHKIPLLKLIETQQSKEFKVQEILGKRDEIFDKAKKKVFKASIIKKKKDFNVEFPPDIRNMMKETYVDYYNNMLPDTMNYIKTHSYRHKFDWTSMMSEGKERGKTISSQYISPTRKDRPKKTQTISFAENEHEQNEV